MDFQNKLTSKKKIYGNWTNIDVLHQYTEMQKACI